MQYTHDNPLRVVTLCSGYDSQCLALDRLKSLHPGFDYHLTAWAEFDPESRQPIDRQPAVIAHNALFPEAADRNLGDMTKINWEQQPDFDLLFYSTPCFVAGTMVLTQSGYKPIEDIEIGDMVLTHTNTFKRVLKTGKKPYCGNLYEINAMMLHRIYCTEHHPFYIRRMYRYGHKSIRAFHEPEWVSAKMLDKNCYLGYAINQKSELPDWDGSIDNRGGHNKPVNKLKSQFENPLFWYLMGRYVGDGWRRYDDLHKAIIIACSDRNRDSLIESVNGVGLNYTMTHERTSDRITIYNRELSEFVLRYGQMAHGKKIDPETLYLPAQLLKSFVLGYIDSDGHFSEKDNHYHITTTSRELALGVCQCIAKAFHAPCKVRFCNVPKTTVIEGRAVNQRDFYTISFKTEKCKQDKAFYENGYIWFPIADIANYTKEVFVYNLEVEEDNSYTANGAIAHNCQSISQAGLQHGFTEGSGTRSSIIWYVRDAVRIKRPKYLILENVKAMVSRKFIDMFNLWQRELERLGYANFAQVLNAKDYGVPQNRERIFLVSIRIDPGDQYPEYRFPKPFPLERRLKDVLEESIDEKYYLSDKMIEYFNRVSEDTTHNHNFKPTDGGGTAFAIRTAPGQRVDDTFVRSEK